MTATVPQHLAALERANVLRRGRAKVRTAVYSLEPKASRRAVAEIVREPGELFEGAPVMYLLQGARRVGRTRALVMLKAIGASEGRKVGELTERQRTVLAGMLEGSS